ncbi:hypothetical protein [Antricoccus suffuscus]|uniref:hypothetical protein n=1 Tax=Antricoccus suffuscus TaxID=1629062 RepID=UPI001EDCDCAA|nr:hypothetical protein [Antricoccus suffuscus]
MTTFLFVGLQLLAPVNGLVFAVAIGQLATALAWSYGTGSVGFPGSAVVIALAAIGSDLVVLNAKSIHFGVLGPILAGAVIAAIVHQVVRRPPRAQVLSSIAQDVFGAVAAASMSLWLMMHEAGDARLLVVGVSAGAGVALLVSHLVDCIGASPRVSYDVPRGVFGFVLAVFAGAGVTAWRLDTAFLSDILGHAIIGGLVALVCVLTSLAMTFIAVDAAPRTWASVVLHAAVPFAMAAPTGLVITLAVAAQAG